MPGIVTQLERRVAELKAEVTSLEAALRHLQTGRPASRRKESPLGTFNLERSVVRKYVSRRGRSTAEVSELIISTRQAELDGPAKRAMWARVHQHLLQLERDGAISRTDGRWIAAAK